MFLWVVACSGKTSPGDSSQGGTSPVDSVPADTDGGQGDSGQTGGSTVETGVGDTDGATTDSGTAGNTEDYHISSTNDYRMVDAAYYATYALDIEGHIRCWGSNCGEEKEKPADTFVDIGAGTSFFCGITTEAGVECWGYESIYGEVSDHPTDKGYIDVDGGREFACAVSEKGFVSCWGVQHGEHGDYGQVTDAPKTGGFTAVAVGQDHACALDIKGEVTCWGNGTQGGTDALPGPYIALSSGRAYTCGIKGEHDNIRCWGGISSPPKGPFHQVDAGVNTACALDTSGAIQCFSAGYPEGGYPNSGVFTSVTAAYYHGCAVRDDGYVVCWGHGTDGEDVPP